MLWRKFLINKKFLIQIILGLMIVGLIPCVLYSAYFSSSIKENIEKQTMSELRMELENLADSIHEKMDSAHWVLQYLLSDSKTSVKLQRYRELNVIDKLEIAEVLSAITRGVDVYAEFCFADVSDGSLYACNYGMTDIENSRYEWLYQYIDQLGTNGKLIFTKPEIYNNIWGHQYYFAALTASKANPNMIGAILFDVESLILPDFDKLSSFGELYLLGEDNTIIYPVDLQDKSKKMIMNDHDTYVQRNIINDRLKLVVRMYDNQLVSKIDEAFRSLTVISSALLLVLLFLIFLISRSLYRPVRQLVNTVYPDDGNINNLDEFSILNNSWRDLNEAVDSYEKAKRTLRRTAFMNNIFGEAANTQDKTLYRLVCMNNCSDNDIAVLEEGLHNVSPAGECLDLNDMLVFVVPAEDLNPVLDRVILPYGLANRKAAAIDVKARTMDELMLNMAEASFALVMSKLISSCNIIHCDMLDRAPEYQRYYPRIKIIYDDLTKNLYGEEALLPLWNDQENLYQLAYTLTTVLYLEIRNHLNNDELLKITGYLNQFIGTDDYTYASYLIEFMVNKRSEAYRKGSRSFQNNVNLRKKHEEKMRLAEQYIEEQYQNQISLEDVAESINVSRQKLCEIFKEIHNITFVNYLNQYRVEQAKKQLGNSENCLEAISTSCGFTSMSYFIRVFKKFTGLTPGEYRKYLNEDDNNAGNREKMSAGAGE